MSDLLEFSAHVEQVVDLSTGEVRASVERQLSAFRKDMQVVLDDVNEELKAIRCLLQPGLLPEVQRFIVNRLNNSLDSRG